MAGGKPACSPLNGLLAASEKPPVLDRGLFRYLESAESARGPVVLPPPGPSFDESHPLCLTRMIPGPIWPIPLGRPRAVNLHHRRRRGRHLHPSPPVRSVRQQRSQQPPRAGAMSRMNLAWQSRHQRQSRRQRSRPSPPLGRRLNRQHQRRHGLKHLRRSLSLPRGSGRGCWVMSPRPVDRRRLRGRRPPTGRNLPPDAPMPATRKRIEVAT